MSVTTFYTQATIDGLTNITADSIDTSILTADSLDLSGNIVCYNISANNISGNTLLMSGTVNVGGNIVMTGGNSYIEFPDGSVQTTAPTGQGVGVVRGYLNAYHGATQTNASVSSANIMQFNTVDSYNGITIANDGVGNPTKIVFSKTGAYLIIISVLVSKTDAGLDEIYMWFAKNGVDITDSNSELHLEKNDATSVITVNFGLNVLANDYVQIKWFSADSAMRLLYEPAQTINGVSLPGSPSVILTVEETNSNYNSLQDVDISGNLFVSGNLDVSGNITGTVSLTDLHLTGNLTVDGSANFTTSAPRTSVAPSNNYDLTNKFYVDSQVSGSATALLASDNTWSGINTYNSELTVIGATADCKFRVETYVDTNIKNNYSDINLDSINLNITGTTNAEAISCTNVDADAVVATSVNSGIGTFTDNTGTTALINVLEYPGGTVYTDYNPLSGDATAGWTYILYSGNGTLTYKGISTSTNIKYVAIGAGGSSSGSDQGSSYNLNGGSCAGSMSGEYKDGSFNTVANSSIAITIGTAGNAGSGGYWSGPGGYYVDATGASAGTNTTTTGSMLAITARCGDRQPAPPATNAHGQDASGAFTSGGNDYGYGNQSGTGSTTRPTNGEFSTSANRCIGGGGCYANQPGYITNYFTSGGTKRIDLYDGRYYYVYAGSSLATVNVDVATPTGIYKWGHGADGPSGEAKTGGRNGAKGGPSCVMFYFPTSTTTSIPGYALSTKGFYNSSYTIPNYDSGWFAVANNTNYTKTHNLNLSILYPPIIWFFFTYTTTPTAPIYMMFPNGLINNNTTNYNSGVMKISPLAHVKRSCWNCNVFAAVFSCELACACDLQEVKF